MISFVFETGGPRPARAGALKNYLTEHPTPHPTPAPRTTTTAGKIIFALLALLALAIGGAVAAVAHPLGNFTVNHFARVEVGASRVGVRYVVDMAEIPAFQEAQRIDADGDGSLSDAELNVYVERVAAQYGENLTVEVDGARLPLRLVAKNVSRPAGAGGVQTLRVECDYAADVPAAAAGAIRRLRFENTNHAARTGWRELVVAPSGGVAVFDSTAYGSAVTDEIKSYPEDKLMAPLDERAAELSWAEGSALPAGASALRTRDGQTAGQGQTRDRLAELIAVRELTPLVALLGLFVAAGLGAIHAFSPGHGKTVVGAYLVGSRGTAKHAAFLGLTVTVTHTAGVFALGLVTLFAAQYVVPERLFPILGFTSGAIVLVIGLSLFAKRLRAALGLPAHAHDAADANDHQHHDGHAHAGDHHHHQHGDDHHHHRHGDNGRAHGHDHAGPVHSHGGREHSHLPPGADGAPVTWRNLLALGVAGGLLPCPSALVVLLAAIAAGRVAYGLALVVAFSVGLAATLTAVGLAFVYAARFVKRPAGESRLLKALPIASALVIAGLGAAICYEAVGQSGVELSTLAGKFFGGELTEASLASYGAFTVLGLGLVFGLKHATEVDHVVAVSTIVSEHRNLLRAALVGGLWGAGHTVSLVAVGVVVLALRVAIPDWIAGGLEFAVALMIIGLGVAAVARALRGRADAHVHRHSHGDGPHVHLHFHESETAHAGDAAAAAHTHAVARVGFKPLLVGAMHGLAGSAALTLLVLTQIESAAVGLLYLGLFGVGSIVGMLLMSGLVGLPFALASRGVKGVSYGLQTLAGAASIVFGLWYAYQTGIASGLLAGIIL